MESNEGKQFLKIFEEAATDAYADWTVMVFESAEAIIDEDDICNKVLSSKEFWLREPIKDYETGNKRVKRSKQASATSNIAIPWTKHACARSNKARDILETLGAQDTPRTAN